MTRRWTFRDYLTADGENLIFEWLRGLPKAARVKINTRIRYFERLEVLERPQVGHLDGRCDGLMELRIYGPDKVQYRPLCCFGPCDRDVTILVGAIEKGSKFVPSSACSVAQQRMTEVGGGGGEPVNTTLARWQQIAGSLSDKEYRDLFVIEEINTGIPFQIRAMRQARGWSQKELAAHAGMTQEGISRLENPDYGKLTLTTLKRLASAFDVGLAVRFVPFSHLVDWAINFSPDDLAVPDYEHDAGLHTVPGIDMTTHGNGHDGSMAIDNVIVSPDTPPGIYFGRQDIRVNDEKVVSFQPSRAHNWLTNADLSSLHVVS